MQRSLYDYTGPVHIRTMGSKLLLFDKEKDFFYSEKRNEFLFSCQNGFTFCDFVF